MIHALFSARWPGVRLRPRAHSASDRAPTARRLPAIELPTLLRRSEVPWRAARWETNASPGDERSNEGGARAKAGASRAACRTGSKPSSRILPRAPPRHGRRPARAILELGTRLGPEPRPERPGSKGGFPRPSRDGRTRADEEVRSARPASARRGRGGERFPTGPHEQALRTISPSSARHGRFRQPGGFRLRASPGARR